MPLAPELTAEFNERFAAWLRIEPRCRHDDFAEGLRACIADPLWMLARQWQTGEFRGEDAGSPVSVWLDYSTQSVDQIRLGGAEPSQPPANVPLEEVVEREIGLLNYRERVRVGQEFERRLRARMDAAGQLEEFENLVEAMRGADTIGFPRTPRAPLTALDRATQRFVGFMRRRVIDGAAVLAGPIGVPAVFSITATELEAVRQEIVDWYGLVCARPTSPLPAAWVPEALQYRFEVNAYAQADDSAVPATERKTRLVAPDYCNGVVDWHTFSAGAEGASNWETASEGADPVITTPTRIEVSGTSRRWWAFEDARTNFGAMDVGRPDLAKLLLMEFVLIYGDDWFSVPAPVSLGSLVKVDLLRVSNVFGDFTDVDPARHTPTNPAERFDLFTISPVDDPIAAGIAVPGATIGESSRPLLFVPPGGGSRQESAPLDEVRFLRDEGSNMVWGVEQIVLNGIGRPVDGFDAQRERLEREREVELAGLEALVADVTRRFENGSLADSERDALRAQARLALARVEELSPHARPTPSQRDVPRYRLSTSVPENWIPFMPVQRRQAAAVAAATRVPGVQLRRAKMLRNTDHGKLDGASLSPDAVRTAAQRLGLSEDAFLWMSENGSEGYVPSMSRVLSLDADALLWLREEAVPRAGLRVQLTKQRVRWTDGTTHVWLGRRVLVGRGEGASGLRADVVGAWG